jgi:hypothetical protein
LLRVSSKSSEWGPAPGESLLLSRFTGNRWRKTTTVLPPFSGPPRPTDAEYLDFLSLSFDSIPCPSCSALGSVSSSTQPGEVCPRCHVGSLLAQGFMLP